MSRSISYNIKNITPDSHYRDIIIAKLINIIMLNGKKQLAEKIFYNAIKIFFNMTNSYSIKTFTKVINYLKPIFEVKQRRIGGATYQVPVTVTQTRSLKLSLRWLVISARNRTKEPNIVDKLANELYDIYNKRGEAYKKKINVHKMAQANKAFAHYRW